MLSDEEVQRRIRAARALRGATVDQLAERINEPGLKSGTLGSIERGERKAHRRELRSIAEALDLPFEFFTIEDFGVLREAARPDEILARLERIEDALAERPQVDYTRLAIEVGRELTSSALASAGVAGETEPSDESRDEADAIPESPGAPVPGTRRSARGAGG